MQTPTPTVPMGCWQVLACHCCTPWAEGLPSPTVPIPAGALGGTGLPTYPACFQALRTAPRPPLLCPGPTLPGGCPCLMPRPCALYPAQPCESPQTRWRPDGSVPLLPPAGLSSTDAPLGQPAPQAVHQDSLEDAIRGCTRAVQAESCPRCQLQLPWGAVGSSMASSAPRLGNRGLQLPLMHSPALSSHMLTPLALAHPQGLAPLAGTETPSPPFYSVLAPAAPSTGQGPARAPWCSPFPAPEQAGRHGRLSARLVLAATGGAAGAGGAHSCERGPGPAAQPLEEPRFALAPAAPHGPPATLAEEASARQLQYGGAGGESIRHGHGYWGHLQQGQQGHVPSLRVPRA